MATIALPQSASKALATPKGKVYAIGGAVAAALLAYLLLGGGGETATTTTKVPTPAVTTATTAAPAPTVPTTPFAVSPRNPFTKGDGSLPQVGKA